MSALITSAVGMAPLAEAQSLLGAAEIAAPVAADVLPGLDTQLDAAAAVLPAAIDFVRTGWEGAAALGADHSLSAVSTSLVDLGTSAAEIAALTADAAGIVVRGAVELAGIAQTFTAQAAGLVPIMLTPAGQIAMVGLVAESVSQAAAVVERVRGELEAPTARMWQIAGEVNATAVASVPVPELTMPAGVQATPAMWSAPVAEANIDAVARASDTAALGSESAETGTVSVNGAPNPQAAAAVEAALSQTGVPYVWGGQSPGSGFDCSGLTQWAYREAGVEIPRTSYDQDVGRQVSRDELAPGDLVVWDGHVAMYIGDGQMVEAGDPVGVSALRTENIGMTFRGFFRPTEQG